jgi:hypothetical protein
VSFKQPHEGIVGTDRSGDDLLSLDMRAVAHRQALVAMAKHLMSATSVGHPAPVVERMSQRLRNPQVGDFVFEWMIGLSPRRDLDTRIKAHGYLVEKRKEWWTTDEEWERRKAEEGWADDEERPTDVAWYIQYGPEPADVCRWTNCDFIVVPIDPAEFTVPFGTRDGSAVTITRDDLLGSLADSGLVLRGLGGTGVDE